MEFSIAIVLFFIAHWFGSLFFQSFFLHRYCSHKMFNMNHFWERFFYILTFIFQGSSFLNPKAYAIMHRLHHAYSDEESDPHSPHQSKSAVEMMLKTFSTYLNIFNGKADIPEKFKKDLVEWRSFDVIADSWTVRFLFSDLYILYYYFFAETSADWFLLPIHFIMGPIHGAIVNWFGHKYGYRNFKDTSDHSRNSIPLDFITFGELMQNNHHKYPSRANFAVKWFEFDPTYPAIWLMARFKIIKLCR